MAPKLPRRQHKPTNVVPKLPRRYSIKPSNLKEQGPKNYVFIKKIYDFIYLFLKFGN